MCLRCSASEKAVQTSEVIFCLPFAGPLNLEKVTPAAHEEHRATVLSTDDACVIIGSVGQSNTSGQIFCVIVSSFWLD